MAPELTPEVAAAVERYVAPALAEQPGSASKAENPVDVSTVVLDFASNWPSFTFGGRPFETLNTEPDEAQLRRAFGIALGRSLIAGCDSALFDRAIRQRIGTLKDTGRVIEAAELQARMFILASRGRGIVTALLKDVIPAVEAAGPLRPIENQTALVYNQALWVVRRIADRARNAGPTGDDSGWIIETAPGFRTSSINHPEPTTRLSKPRQIDHGSIVRPEGATAAGAPKWDAFTDRSGAEIARLLETSRRRHHDIWARLEGDGFPVHRFNEHRRLALLLINDGIDTPSSVNRAREIAFGEATGGNEFKASLRRLLIDVFAAMDQPGVEMLFHRASLQSVFGEHSEEEEPTEILTDHVIRFVGDGWRQVGEAWSQTPPSPDDANGPVTGSEEKE